MRIDSHPAMAPIAHPPKRGLPHVKLIAPHTGPVHAPPSAEDAHHRKIRRAHTKRLMGEALERLRRPQAHQAPKATLYFTGGTAPER